MKYRIGNHNPALVYAEPEDAEHYTPRPRGELIAVFVQQGGENELDALQYVRAMNATMPGCTCRVVCCCGALVGTTSGCETCAEHTGECLAGEVPVAAAALRVMADEIDRGPTFPMPPSVISALIRERADALEADRG